MTGSSTAEALTVDLATLRRRHVDHHTIDCTLAVSWLAGVLASTDAEVSQPAAVALALHLQPRGVVVATGTLEIGFDVPCGRCLTPAPVAETSRIVATYVPSTPATRGRGATEQPSEDDDNELGLTADDLDTWTYEGVTLSLEAMVAEQVKLAYPMRVLCFRGEACRGLCSNCGADLNAQAPEGTTCETCGRRVPKTPVADPPSAQAPGAGGATLPDPAAGPTHAEQEAHAGQPGEDDPFRPENPLAAAIKKLIS